MKRMLINGTHSEEMRIALVDGQRLYDLDIESRTGNQKKSNIYKGIVTRIEPSLEAVFVDYGVERHGFLPFKEIDKSYLSEEFANAPGRPNIKDGLKEGAEIIVQVDKEERGNKGAALTTFISLAGRYLVLMPNNPRSGGVSRRIEGDERAQVREALNEVVVPKGMSTIVRTAGVGRTSEELQWDLDYLDKVWSSVSEAAAAQAAPFLIYQESNIIIRALRDYFRDDIKEILIDTPALYQQANDFVQMVMPDKAKSIKLYQDPLPLFTRYQVESQIETAFQREVKLPSGGALVIDYTEALVSIDINSARSTKGADIEETALHTNLEAADEIARQMRLRDLGGLLVIDFIDMDNNKAQREVENRLRDALSTDRARIQTARISKFGLMEVSRQRLRPSLDEASHITCPRCDGQGSIRNIQSVALAIVRLIQEEAIKDKTGRILVHAPVKVATYLLNEKRHALFLLEDRLKINISIIPTETLETPHFSVVRQREDDIELSQDLRSFELNYDGDTHEDNSLETAKPTAPIQAAAVQSVSHSRPAPQTTSQEHKSNIFAGIATAFTSLIGTKKAAEAEQPEPEKPSKNNASSNKGQAKKENQARNNGKKQSEKSKESKDSNQNNRKNSNAPANKKGNNSSNNGSKGNSSRKSEPKGSAQEQTERTQPKPKIKTPRETQNDKGEIRQVYAGRERLPEAKVSAHKAAELEKKATQKAKAAIAASATPIIGSLTQGPDKSKDSSTHQDTQESTVQNETLPSEVKDVVEKAETPATPSTPETSSNTPEQVTADSAEHSDSPQAGTPALNEQPPIVKKATEDASKETPESDESTYQATQQVKEDKIDSGKEAALDNEAKAP